MTTLHKSQKLGNFKEREELLLLARNEEKQYGATADVEQVLRAVSQEQLFMLRKM